MGQILVKLSDNSTVIPDVNPLANNSETADPIKLTEENFKFSKKISQIFALNDLSIPKIKKLNNQP